jgi:hypothetical protein
MIPLSATTMRGDSFRSITFCTINIISAPPEVSGLGGITVAPGLTGPSRAT